MQATVTTDASWWSAVRAALRRHAPWLRRWRKAPAQDLERYLAEPLPHEAHLRECFAPDAPLVIFDVGSCEGEDTLRYLRMFPQARCFAFEPVPANAAKIRETLARRAETRVTAVEAAVSDRDGVAELHLSSGHPRNIRRSPHWDFGNKSSSLLEPSALLRKHAWLRFRSLTQVRTIRLETFLAQQGIAAIDLLHVDVQGAEGLVLDGAGAALHRIRAIWIEVAHEMLYRGQPLAGDLEQRLTEAGFTKVLDTAAGTTTGDHLYLRQPR